MSMTLAMTMTMACRMRIRNNGFGVRHAARMHTRTHRKGGPALVSATGGLANTNRNTNTNTNINTNTNTDTGTGAIRLQVRNLHLHEWSSMELLRKNGIPTPRGYLAETPDEAEELFRKHFACGKDSGSGSGSEGSGFAEAVLKAQVLSGSRCSGTFDNGFRGGVRVVSDPSTARTVADRMLGRKLVTRQAPDGLLCRRVMIQERLRLSRELYVSIWMDRSSQGPLLIGSPLGGGTTTAAATADRGIRGSRSLVEVARSHPHLVFVEEIDVGDGLEADRCERMAENLGLDPGTPSFDQAVDCMRKLYEVFVALDCTQIEVNPLGEAAMIGGGGGNDTAETTRMVVVDAKVQFDDNAEFRQPDIFALRDYDQEDPREAEATRHGIDYIGLGKSGDGDGKSSNKSNIGCMVNGAGLAMATMDLVVAHGGGPSNFLDVGGGATPEQVGIALGILERDPSVKVVLVNIFGGILRCDVIARGILDLAGRAGMGPKTPVVIRLQGTNYEEAEAVLARSGLEHVHLEGDLETAVRLAVKLAAEAEEENAKSADAGAEAEAEAITNAGNASGATGGDGGDAPDGARFVSEKRSNNKNKNDDDDLPKFEGFSI